MPSSNGVYSLPAGYLAVTGTTIQASQHNPPLEDIAAALTLRLSRDGTAAMTGPIQLASGAVGAPGAVFAADPASGFYKTASGIGVSVGGVKVAEFLTGGISGARFLGELIPYTCTAALPLTVLPNGQTLNRITYAALWTQAQIEIAAGNTLYNNGDGSTTFGVPDMRGRVPAGFDAGNVAGRLTTGPNAAVLGSTGGAATVTLLTANLPPYTPAGSVSLVLNNGLGQLLQGGTGGPVNIGGTGSGGSLVGPGQVLTFTGTAQGGTSTPVANVQPTIITNYLLFAGA